MVWTFAASNWEYRLIQWMIYEQMPNFKSENTLWSFLRDVSEDMFMNNLISMQRLYIRISLQPFCNVSMTRDLVLGPHLFLIFSSSPVNLFVHLGLYVTCMLTTKFIIPVWTCVNSRTLYPSLYLIFSCKSLKDFWNVTRLIAQIKKNGIILDSVNITLDVWSYWCYFQSFQN